MARRRYVSTGISVDKAVNRLGAQYGDFAALLYVLMIPHAEDDATLTGDPDELLATVCPMRRDKTAEDVAQALRAMVSLDLITWDEAGAMVYFPVSSFYKYQTYIPPAKRRGCSAESAENTGDDMQSAQFSEQRRETPKNAAYPSPSPSVKPTDTPLSPPKGEQEGAEGECEDEADTALPSESESEPFEPVSRAAVRGRAPITLSPEQQKRFDRFFASYPNREKKQKAVEAWAKINPDPELLAVMAAGLKRWKESERWTKDSGRFVMLASTWLNQSCWNDEPTPAATPGNTPPSGNHTDRYPSRPTQPTDYATGPKLQDLTGIGGDTPIRSFPARRQIQPAPSTPSAAAKPGSAEVREVRQ